MKRPSTKDDSGETLIELLVALGIMATAVVALVGAVATSLRKSEPHRRQTESCTHVKAFADTRRGEVAHSPNRYTPCGTVPGPAATYQGLYSVPPGHATQYVAEVVNVTYWDGVSAFTNTCPAAGDYGVQLVSLKVRGLDGSRAAVEEKLDITL